MKKLIISIFFLILSITQIHSQSFWTYLTQFSGTPQFASNSLNQIFAGTTSGVFRSNDNGDTWTALSLTSSINSLVVSQQGYIFAGTLNGIFMSSDNGNLWTFKGLNNSRTSKISISPQGQICLADSTGVYLSTDNGNSWVNKFSGGLNDQVISIANNQSGNIFVGVNGPSYRSVNNGNNWDIMTGPTQASFSVGLNGYIFGGMYHISDNMGGYVLRSTDNGGSWSPMNLPLAGCRYYTSVNPLNGYVYAGGTCGLFVYYSSNNGDTWNIIEDGLTGHDVVSFGFEGNGYIYAGQQNGKIYRAYMNITAINPITTQIPDNFSLSQNYPNPFNPSTNIKFQIAKSSDAKLVIYDALGKEIETLVDKKLEPGEYEAEFDGSDLPSGVYYYKLVINPSDLLERADGYTETKKMVLIK